MFEKFRLTLAKKRCECECNKTIISEHIFVFSFVKTSGYHLKVFVFKLNQIHICQTTIVENISSILRQNKQHEQIEIMANHGPFCKRIKMIKKHPQINHVEKTDNVKWCVFKVPQYMKLFETLFFAS